jgi:hypothetical protein
MGANPIRNLSGWRLAAVVLGLAFVVILGVIYWKNSSSRVVLRPQGKATFYRGGFFHQDEFTLTKYGNKWHFYRSEPFEMGELILPFECPYNEYRTLRLENDGRVFMLDKDKMTREELRVVNGEWSYDASDHWQSIFDIDY